MNINNQTASVARSSQVKLPPVSNAHCSCYNYEYLLFFARAVIGSLKIATCRRNTKYIKVFWLAVFSSPPPPPSSYARWLHLSVLVCMRKDCHGLSTPKCFTMDGAVGMVSPEYFKTMNKNNGRC